MAYHNGPKIVTDGLVMALDVANVKSFRGEPTTNEKTNFLSLEVTPSQNYNPTQFNWIDITDTPMDVWRNRALTIRMNSGGVNGAQWYWVNQGNYIGKTITFSWFAKLTSGSSTTDTICIAEGGYSNGNTVTSYTVTSEWQRVSVTRTILTSNSITLGSAESAFPLNTTIAYTGFQLEEKPYTTPVVSGSRGTTVATGGGWADLSGNSSHGELVNGPTYNSSSRGSLVFDGINDLISITSAPNYNTNVGTISVWVYPNITSSETIFMQYNTDLHRLRIYHENERMVVFSGYSTTTLSLLTSIGTVPFGRWSHISFTYDFTVNIFTLYVNGVSLASTTNTTVPDIVGLGEISIGAAKDFDNPSPHYSNFFNGRMATVNVYNRVLTPNEIAQMFNTTRGRFGI